MNKLSREEKEKKMVVECDKLIAEVEALKVEYDNLLNTYNMSIEDYHAVVLKLEKAESALSNAKVEIERLRKGMEGWENEYLRVTQWADHLEETRKRLEAALADADTAWKGNEPRIVEICKLLGIDYTLEEPSIEDTIKSLQASLVKKEKQLRLVEEIVSQQKETIIKYENSIIAKEKMIGEAVELQCPYPEDIWTMTDDQYVTAVPDPNLRTAISGFLMRKGWEVYKSQLEQLIQKLAGGGNESMD